MYIHNDVRTWATWDHCAINARIRDEGQATHFARKRKEQEEVDRMEAKDRRANNRIQKKVMEKNDDTGDDLATFQRTIETAAGEVAHHTKAERENLNEYT